MTKPAAITAELVDVRNVGMHKCIKLTLHVPAERAAEVIAAFGWATAVDPVPVALARLDTGGPVPSEATIIDPVPVVLAKWREGLGAGGPVPREAVSDPDRPDAPPPATKPRPAVAPEKRMTQRAAIMCNDPAFQNWLKHTNSSWRIMTDGTDEERAAAIVRARCKVRSRTEIQPGTEAARAWDQMLSEYTIWALP